MLLAAFISRPETKPREAIGEATTLDYSTTRTNPQKIIKKCIIWLQGAHPARSHDNAHFQKATSTFLYSPLCILLVHLLGRGHHDEELCTACYPDHGIAWLVLRTLTLCRSQVRMIDNTYIIENCFEFLHLFS